MWACMWAQQRYLLVLEARGHLTLRTVVLAEAHILTTDFPLLCLFKWVTPIQPILSTNTPCAQLMGCWCAQWRWIRHGIRAEEPLCCALQTQQAEKGSLIQWQRKRLTASQVLQSKERLPVGCYIIETNHPAVSRSRHVFDFSFPAS